VTLRRPRPKSCTFRKDNPVQQLKSNLGVVTILAAIQLSLTATIFITVFFGQYQ